MHVITLYLVSRIQFHDQFVSNHTDLSVYVLVMASLILKQHSNNCNSSSPPSHNALSHSAIANAAYALGIAGIVAIGIRASCI